MCTYTQITFQRNTLCPSTGFQPCIYFMHSAYILPLTDDSVSEAELSTCFMHLFCARVLFFCAVSYIRDLQLFS
jgi:hypothetical protein